MTMIARLICRLNMGRVNTQDGALKCLPLRAAEWGARLFRSREPSKRWHRNMTVGCPSTIFV